VVPNSVGDTTRTKTQGEATVWLIGDRYGKRQGQLEHSGWEIGFSKCSSIIAETRRSMFRRIAEEKSNLLYIVEFGGMDNGIKTASFLENLIEDQLKLCGLILIEAPKDSPTWTSSHAKRSEEPGWTTSVTRWCGLTAEPQTTKGECERTPKGERGPSKLSTYTRANFPLLERSKCNCGIQWGVTPITS